MLPREAPSSTPCSVTVANGVRCAAVLVVSAIFSATSCREKEANAPGLSTELSQAPDNDAAVAAIDAGKPDGSADGGGKPMAGTPPPDGPTLADQAALDALAHAAGSQPPGGEKRNLPLGLRLVVVERGPGQPWGLGISNESDRPVRIIADPRLLWFDVAVPSKKTKTVTCKLPESLFPGHADRRSETILAPGEGVVHSFDPRLYCFASGGQKALVPGAVVTPHFGWPVKKKPVATKKGKRKLPEETPPFIATPAPTGNETWHVTEDDLCAPEKPERSKTGEKSEKSKSAKEQSKTAPSATDKSTDTEEPPVRCAKVIDAAPFGLTSEYKAWASTRLEQDKPVREHPGPLELDLTQGSDAEAERTATIALRVKNRSKRAQRVYFRRELVSFEIMTPDGPVTCDAQPDQRSPDPQEFSRIGKGGSIQVTSRLVELCPHGTFGRPGFYLVHARFDADISGDQWGLDAFTGRVVSLEPASVRIRTGELPFLHKRAIRRVDVGQGEIVGPVASSDAGAPPPKNQK